MVSSIERFLSRRWGMMLTLAVPCFVVLATLLAGRQVFGSFIGIEHQFQFAYFYQNAFRSGDSWLWNSYNFSGFPTFVDVNTNFFSPFMYVVLHFFSVPISFYIEIFVFLLLSAWFTNLLLEELDISALGRLTGALVYLFVIGRQSLPDATVQSSFVVLPLLLWIVMRIARTDATRINKGVLLSLGSLAIALEWFGSHWHFLLNFLLVGFLFSLFIFCERVYTADTYKIAIKKYIFIPMSYLAMVFFGTILGLVKMVPTYVLMNLSYRAGGFTSGFVASEGLAWTNILTLISPTFDHPLLYADPEWIYLGTLPLFLFVVGFALRGMSKRTFFSYLFIFSIAVAVKGSPLFKILQTVPPFSFTHTAARWVYVAGFAIAIVAAYGFDILRYGREEEKTKKMARITRTVIGIFVAVSFLGGIVTMAAKRFQEQILFLAFKYFDTYIYSPSVLSLDHFHAYLLKMFNKFIPVFDFTNEQFLFAFVFLAAGYVVLRMYAKNTISRERLILVIVAIIALNFMVSHATFGDRFARALYDREPSTVQFLKTREPGRVFSFLEGSVETAALENIYHNDPPANEYDALFATTLVPSRNMRYGIESAGYDATIVNLRMALTLAYIGGQISEPDPIAIRKQDLSFAQKSLLFTERRPIISLLGIRYITSAYPLDETIFPKIFETTATSKNIPVYIYENTEARPLYYFTKETELVDLPSSVTPQEIHALIEQTEKTDFITQDGITLQERKNAALTFTTRISKPQLFVLSQNNLPGWRVFIDNERVPLHTFATVYQAVAVPQGMHDIRFEYSYGEIWREFFKNKI